MAPWGLLPTPVANSVPPSSFPTRQFEACPFLRESAAAARLWFGCALFGCNICFEEVLVITNSECLQYFWIDRSISLSLYLPIYLCCSALLLHSICRCLDDRHPLCADFLSTHSKPKPKPNTKPNTFAFLPTALQVLLPHSISFCLPSLRQNWKKYLPAPRPLLKPKAPISNPTCA
jgi:hypothetical protein